MAWHSRPSVCASCPANATARSFAPSRGLTAAPLLLLDSAPDEIAASLGSPLAGDAGARLGTWLRLAGIDQQRCRFSGVSWCWLPERDPTRAEIEHCRDAHWGAELAGRRVIVPIGIPAMRQFYQKAGESTAGQIIRHESGAYVVGLLHPAFILRGNFGLEPLQIQTLKLVKRILDGWEPEVYDFSKPHAGANLYPTMEQLRAWSGDFQPGDEVAIDVEAAGRVLTMVGLCRVRDLSHVAVWFRQPGGDPWPHPSWEELVGWLYDFLADPLVGKCFHNAAYDIEQLEETGFEIEGFSFDTLLAAHIAYPEMRKRLESVALLTAGITGWKAMLRDGEGHQK